MSQVDTQPVDPRVEFWSEQSPWPRNATGVVFLARIVHHLGWLMFGAAWTGTEPETVVIHAIRPQLSAETPRRDIDYACSLLTRRHLGYRQRAEAALSAGEPLPLPTPEEWAVARAWSEQIENETAASLDRFIAVITVLLRVFEQGIVRTATRPYMAGNLSILPAGEWFNECYLAWFSTCQINPEYRYSRTPLRFGGLWIYVDLESYENWLALAFDTIGKPRPMEAGSSTSSPRSAVQPEEQVSGANVPDPSASSDTPAPQAPETKPAKASADHSTTKAATIDSAVPNTERAQESTEAPSVQTRTQGDELQSASPLVKAKASTGDRVVLQAMSSSTGQLEMQQVGKKKRRPGARTKYDWPPFSLEVERRFNAGNAPASVHEFADQMAEWCELTWGKEPADSTLRSKIAAILDKNGWTLE